MEKNKLIITKACNGYICKKNDGKLFVFKKAIEIVKVMAKDIENIANGSEFIIEYEINDGSKD